MTNKKEESKNDQAVTCVTELGVSLDQVKNVTELEASLDQEKESVGYRKPPRQTQFKPGQSGNPNGRPRKKESLHDRLSRIFLKEISVRRGGKTEKMSQIEALLQSQFVKATQGDTRAVQFCVKIAEQLGCLKHVFEGRPLQPAEYPLDRAHIDQMSIEEISTLIEIFERADAKLNGGH